MLSWADFNYSHYLDSLAAELNGAGYDVWYSPFTYAAEFNPLVANSVQDTLVQIDGDADFVIVSQQCNNPADDVEIELRLETSQRELQNEATQIGNVFGTGDRPFFLYKPLMLQKKSTMRVRARNDAGSNTTVRLAFSGVKVFTKPLGAAA